MSGGGTEAGPPGHRGPGRWPWPEGPGRDVAGARLDGGTWVRADGAIDSVQWADLAGWRPELDLARSEREYFAWVPRLTGDLVWPEVLKTGGPEPLAIHATPWGLPTVIQMSAPTVAPRRRARAILGGFAAHASGELAFELHERPGATRLVVALTTFRPRSPLPLYLRTQRVMHERSTFGFLRQVARAWR